MNLSDDQIAELLTYHRIKRRSQHVCKDCVEESQTAERTCFVCNRTYTEKHGPRGSKGEPDPEFMEMMRALSQKGKNVEAVTAKSDEETKARLLEAFKAKCAERGIKLIE